MKRWRYRPLQAAAVAALAALMTACAVLAPLYYRAMQQSLTTITLDQAPVIATSVQLQSAPASDFDPSPVLQPEQVASSLPARYRSLFERPVLGNAAGAVVAPYQISDPIGEVIWRTGACDHLTFTAGRCPTASGEVAVSAKDAELFGYDVGAVVRVKRSDLRGKKQPARLDVVGVYEQEVTDYWFGQPLTGKSGVLSSEPPAHVQHDVFVADRASFDDPDLGLATRASTAGFLLRRGAVDVDDLLALGPAIDGLAHERAEPGAAPLHVVTDLPRLARDVQDQIDQSRITVPLLMAQLCLLAVVVLWLVLLAITEQRRPEVALARLRGRGRRGARGLLLAELLPIPLVALVPGALLGVLACWIARRRVLPADPPFELGWPFVAALVLAAVVLVAVTLLAVTRVAREPVEQLLRRVPPRSVGWALGATDAVVIAGAGGIVVVFATGGLDGPIALAAPGLLAIVVGLVLAHLTAPVAALLGRRLLQRGRVRPGVSLLDAARSPATRRIVAIVTLASALAVFSADALLVGQRNRSTAAQQEAGAPQVAEVRGNELAAVRAALDEVDPEGRRVTPVVRVQPPGEDAVATIAVVPQSFRRIALFPGGAPDAALWDRLRPPDAKPIELTGAEFSVDLTDSTLRSTRVDGERGPVTVGLDLVNVAGETLHTTLGQLQPGATGGRFTHRVSCTETCKITGVWFGTLPGATIDGKVTLGRVLADGSDKPVQIGPADQWTEFSDRETGTVTPTSQDPGKLTVEVSTGGAALVTLQQNWLPAVVPALVSGALPSGGDGNEFPMSGLDGEAQTGARVGTLARVPASAPRSFVANLDALERGRSVLATDRIEIWMEDDDPALLAEVSDALAARGVELAGSHTLGDIRRGYDESSAAWSLQLAALVGAAAILIALLVLVVSAVSSWRLRTRDLAALRMSGVPTSSLRAMAVAAQLPAVLVGVVAGGVSGLIGAQLAMPIVPLFATAPQVSTLDLDTAWSAVLLAAVLSLVVLGAGSVLIGRMLAARAELRRLRETV